MSDSRDRQYRATRLWNSVIRSFRDGMPKGKHRRHMRTFDNCFVASDAISWLHEHLQDDPNFGPAVTRHQTMQLLQKFLENRIIEAVKSGKPRVIQDDKQLYRFTVYSPVKTPPSAKFPPKAGSGRTPLLARENKPNFPPEAHRVSAKALAFLFGAKQDASRPLATEVVKDPSESSKEPGATLVTREEMQGIWESVVLARLRCLVGEEATDGSLNGFRISGADILHNMYRLSRNGVVILLDKSDDLPKWIINAMKCLIHWPRASGAGSCLPNYPGFELDVLKVVSEFFSGLGTALVPQPILRLFYHAFGPLVESCKVPEEPPTPDASVENLLHSMSILALPVEATAKPHQFTKPSLQPSLSGRHLVYRTAFESADPVTVLIESQGSVEHAFALSAETASTISSCSGGFTRPLSPAYSDVYSDVYNLACSGSVGVAGFSGGFDTDKKPIGVPRSSSAEDLNVARHFTHATMSAPKEALVRSTASVNVDGFLTLRQIKKEREARRGNMLVGEGYVNLGYGSSSSLTSDWQVAVQRSAGSVSYTTAPTQVSVASSRDGSFVSASDSVTCLRYARSNPSCESLPVLVHSTPAETGKTAGPFYANISSLRPRENSEDLRRAVKVMQVASLLLPPCRRRYLHLLLRFIYKTSRNEVLTLIPHHSNMSVLLNTFACILMSTDGSCLEATPDTAQELLAFLVKHCDRIFAPPRELHLEVEARLTILRRERANKATTYCQQVTREQFEAQKRTLSEQALMDLFDDILRDPRISDKERNTRMKQFRQNYPDIYNKKTCDEPVPVTFKRNSRSRATVIGLLRSLRL
ncbi:DEP domain-containing protein 1A-like [Rhipicephalus microplus]|uniref:DEP domain-containing protein 1A-like n=1 Tax=Rhipicephalus microplus TaxID=6941 RepID=UPI003F6C8E03